MPLNIKLITVIGISNLFTYQNCRSLFGFLRNNSDNKKNHYFYFHSLHLYLTFKNIAPHCFFGGSNWAFFQTLFQYLYFFWYKKPDTPIVLRFYLVNAIKAWLFIFSFSETFSLVPGLQTKQFAIFLG